MIFILKSSFILILLIISVFAVEEEQLAHHRQHQHSRCVEQHQLIVIPQQNSHQRLLQISTPHGLRILGQYFLTTQNQPYNSTISTMFAIAAYYYQNVITVTSISQANTLYNSNSTCGTTVPTSYITSGYNLNIYDMVMFLITVNDTTSDYIALAAPCLLVRWPTYGYIRFNLAYMTVTLSTPSKAASFHNNVYVVLHQMVHILGFSTAYYNLYYVSYFSSNLRTNAVVTLPSNSSRLMIVTPTVLSYVQNYFGCNDSTTGALLQDQGATGSSNVHWQRGVYYDEMMTSSYWPNGLKISGLTMSLLADTGFYYSVDVTMVQPFSFGKNQGCLFAQEASYNYPQFCNNNNTGSTQCDWYSYYQGYCSNDPFSNSDQYIIAYSNEICTFPESNFNTSSNTFGSGSRCLNGNFGEGNQPYCLTAQCINNNTGVSISSNGNTAICNNGTVSISLNGGTITCPTNLAQFCLRSTCDNWCSFSGLCINGNCLGPNLTAIPYIVSNSSNNSNGSSSLTKYSENFTVMLSLIFITLWLF